MVRCKKEVSQIHGFGRMTLKPFKELIFPVCQNGKTRTDAVPAFDLCFDANWRANAG